jgi:hypothetical protein
MSEPEFTKSASSTVTVAPAQNRPGDDEFGDYRITGYIADLPDARDLPLYPPVAGSLPGGPAVADGERAASTAVTPKGKVEGWEVPAFRQQPYASCASCAVVSVVQYLAQRMGLDDQYSRRFLYYNTRAHYQRYADRRPPGTVPDCTMGTGLRNVLKALNKFGICEEALLPYDQGRCEDEPSEDAYTNARTHFLGTVAYRRIFRLGDEPGQLDLDPLRRAIVEDTPPIIGFAVYESFKDAAENGEPIPIPKRNERLLFGHAAVLIEYGQRGQDEVFTCVNSWDGDPGGRRFLLPAEYLQNALLCRDVWALTSLVDGSGTTDGGENAGSVTITTTGVKSG